MIPSAKPITGALIHCQACGNPTFGDLKYCPACGAGLTPPISRCAIPAAHRHARQGPRATVFPPAPQTSWNHEELRQSLSGSDGNALETTRLFLQTGQYDLAAFYEEGEDAAPECEIWCAADATERRRVTPLCLGRRIEPGRHCLRFAIGEEGAWVRFGLDQAGPAPARIGLLLIPRFGAIWPAAQLQHHDLPEGKVYGCQTRDGAWSVNGSEVLDEILCYGPYTPLAEGDYVVFFRLACDAGPAEGDLLTLDVAHCRGCVIVSRQITRADLPAAGGFSDFAVRFHFTHTCPPETEHADEAHKAEFRVKVCAPVNVTIEHVRLVDFDALIEERWYELGGASSVLGLPVGATFTAEPSRYGTQGRLRRFTGGTIYCSPEHGAVEVYGPIGNGYEEAGGTNESLVGFPIGPVEAVTSSYGTHAHVQPFEGHGWVGRIFACEQNAGVETHIVYGGISYTYLFQEGGPSGSLGLPLTSEYVVERSPERAVHRNDFEGGFIEWEWTQDAGWQHKHTIRYPRPRITSVEYPQTSVQGDVVRIRLEARNDGETAEEGYLSISLPDAGNDEIEVRSDAARFYVQGPGVDVACDYGRGRTVLAYPRPEACFTPWRAGESHWLELALRPNAVGDFRFYVRATAGPVQKYGSEGYRYEGDPLPTSSQPLDQQQERVYEHRITVQERLLPELVIEGLTLSNLRQHYRSKPAITVRNCGRGPACQVTVSAPAEYGGERSRPVEIAAGMSAQLRVGLTPTKLGEQELVLTVGYQDSRGTALSLDIEMEINVEESSASSLPPIVVGQESIVIIRGASGGAESARWAVQTPS